jgi:hypothetical protein
MNLAFGRGLGVRSEKRLSFTAEQLEKAGSLRIGGGLPGEEKRPEEAWIVKRQALVVEEIDREVERIPFGKVKADIAVKGGRSLPALKSRAVNGLGLGDIQNLADRHDIAAEHGCPCRRRKSTKCECG